MKTINYILVGLLLLTSILFGISRWSNNREITELQNQLANATKPTTVVVGNDSTVVALTEQVRKIKTENDAIKKVMKKTDSKARYWAEVAGNYAAELDSLEGTATVDTVFVVDGDSVVVRQFEKRLGIIDVAGNFDTKSPWEIRFTKAEIEKLRFELMVVEANDGTWRTFISGTPPGFRLEPSYSKVVPYKAPWYSKLHLAGEIKSDGGGLGVGFGNWTGMYYTGDIVGLQYSWYLFRRK